MVPPIETVATLVFNDDHDTVRPLRTLPVASRTIAEAPMVCPGLRLALPRMTVTVATGSTPTVSVASPVAPSDAARMTTAPVDTALTTPFGATLAIDGSSDDQVTVRPVSGLPRASVTVAVACVVCPGRILFDPRETVTPCTGATPTVSVMVNDLPSDVTVSVAEPGPRPVILALSAAWLTTVKTELLLEAQLMLRPVSMRPAASTVTALACTI